MKPLIYTVIVTPLSVEDGGGFLATVPDLPGCMSDGETPEQAIAHVREAIDDWLDESRALGRAAPIPTTGALAAS
jgi:predicted RNase H-like HicB family nuclease